MAFSSIDREGSNPSYWGTFNDTNYGIYVPRVTTDFTRYSYLGRRDRNKNIDCWSKRSSDSRQLFWYTDNPNVEYHSASQLNELNSIYYWIAFA